MRTRSNVVACLVFAVTAASAGRATAPQDPSEPPIFRTGSDFIRVDMYPTRDGEIVTDLRRDEVEIVEDGVRQQALTFEYVDASSGGTSEPDFDEELADARSRVFVVFIDTHTTALLGDNALRLSLVRFLDRLLQPDDLVGVMTPDMPVSAVTLSRRSTVISDLANDVRWLEDLTQERADLTEFAWENCYPSRRGPSSRVADMKARRNAMFTIDALHDLVWHLRDLREERKAVLLVTAGWPFVEAVTLDRGGDNESKACADDRRALARINYMNLLKDVTEAANRANVSFYPVSAREELVLSDRLRPTTRQRLRQRDTRERQIVRDQLRLLADSTDGMADVERDFDRVAARVSADTSSYYLIGYQSTNPNADGAFRTISVSVNRPGVRVRARTGYGGTSPAPRLSGPESLVPPPPVVDGRIAAALTPVERFDTLAPFWGRFAAWEPLETSGAAFWFVGELGGEARTAKPWNAGAMADVVVLDGGKSEILTRTVALDPKDGAFLVRVPVDGMVPHGAYSVRVRLRAAGDAEVNVHDSAHVTLDGATEGLGDALLWRRGSSALQDFRLTADPRFRRTERLRLELPTASPAPVSARLLDRFGQPLEIPMPVAERPDTTGDFRWVVIETPLAALAPAYYTIEVTQGDTSRFTAFQLVP